MTEEQETKEARKKRLQAEAHKRWRLGPKGQAYKQKQKHKDAGIEVPVLEQTK